MEKIKKWFSNYWYHYKWPTIVIAFFAAVLIMGIYQMATKDTYDINVLYSGPAILNKDQTSGIENAFASILPKDYNKDEEKSVLINRFTILSEEQLAEKEEQAKAENDSVYYDPTSRSDTISQITTLFATGETSICLMDAYVYSIYLREGAFVTLEEVLGEVPEYARDDYSVYLADTPFGKYFDNLQALPADTILCFRKEAVFAGGSKSKSNAQYEFDKSVFRAVFEFEAPAL